MSPTKPTTRRKDRRYTGVSLEPEIMRYLDDLSRRMGLNRSWVLNTIVYEYARYVEHKELKPVQVIERVIRL